MGGPRLRVEEPTSLVPNPARPSTGACRIEATPFDGLRVDEGMVVRRVRAQPGLLGRAYLACASTRYTLGKWSLVAAILVDAASPGRFPARLFGMRAAAGHRGYFEAPGWPRTDVARRISGGWLVVTSGVDMLQSADMQQRLRLLEHLRGSVTL